MEGRLTEETRRDLRIIRVLPYLVLSCISAGLLNIAFRVQDKTFGSVLLGMCEPFVGGFMLLGVYSLVHAAKGTVRSPVPSIIFAVGPIIVAAFSFFLGLTVIPDVFGSDLFRRTDDLFADILLCSGKLYVIMVLSIFVVYGVVSVVSSYFRQYIHRVYRFVGRLRNDGTDERRGRFTLRLFDVPEIIDIRGVELEHADRGRAFPMEDFVSMTVSIFTLGLTVCSYIFLNPMFMKEMTIYETMMIGIIISFFVPVLVMPWYIIRETGAKVKSQARDLYLWKGMRKRLYQSFSAFMLILFLILLTLYLGADVLRVTYTYIGYTAFMVFLSMTYSYVFFNNYNIGVKETILRKFRGT